MKPALLVLLTIMPVAVLAAQNGQESMGDTTHQAVSNSPQQKPAVSTQMQDAPTDDLIDPLPISKKKCLAVDENGFCSQWATN